MRLAAHDKLVMIGDSITDCGRNRPVAEGLFDPLGKGYVTLVDALLSATYPERHIRVVNVGCSGNNILDLDARWQTDVLDLQPTWLSVLIGINDVWRQFDLPRQPEQHVDLATYRETYDRLLASTRPGLQGLVLMSPFFIEPNPAEPMRARIAQYSDVCQELAARHDALFVDLQAAFDRILDHWHPSALAWDRIHPSQIGHMAIAKAFLNAIDFAW